MSAWGGLFRGFYGDCQGVYRGYIRIHHGKEKWKLLFGVWGSGLWDLSFGPRAVFFKSRAFIGNPQPRSDYGRDFKVAWCVAQSSRKIIEV